MLDGIHILSETVKQTSSELDLFFGWMFAILAVICLICSIAFIIYKDSWRIGSVILFITCVIISCYSLSTYKQRKSYTLYKVTIDDNVSFNEFNQGYRVLDREGKIYTIKER